MDGIVGAIFIFILLLVIGFVAHEIEEIYVQRKWMLKNEATLKQRFPKLRKVFDHLLSMDTIAFTFAVLEESVVLVLIIFAFINNGEIGDFGIMFLCGLFFAYTMHLLVHIIQGIIFRGYVPGLVTSIIQFLIFGPFLLFYFKEIHLFLAGLAGVCFLFLNLLFAHWLGKKVSNLIMTSK